jgi:hypothetical protein
MAWTHTGAGGFSRRHPREDHFVTSVDIGNHIARVVLARCEAAARRHGIPDPWIVDVGAGDGRLLADLLALGFPGDRLLGVDVRPAPDLPVRWVQAVAPDCLPRISGVLFAHEFLDDVPAQVVVGGHVLTARGTPGPAADPEDLAWQRRWGKAVVGRSRDVAWARLVDSVAVGEAIAVDYRGDSICGQRRGRPTHPRADGDTDLSAGVELRSCRAVTGGRLVPQHRVLAQLRARSPQEAAELAVLRDREGFGAFGWLITDVASVGSPA